MQFKDDKNNFTFSGNINCNISIGNPYNRDNIKQPIIINPIEKAISEAKEYIYIISPYVSFSESKKPKLIPIKDILIKKAEENENIKIKLICSYTANQYKNYEIDRSYLRVFNSLIKKVTGSNLKEEEKEIDKNISDKKTFSSKTLIGSIALLIFSSSSIGLLSHLNKLSKNYFNSLGLAFLLSIIGILISLIKIFNLKKDKQKQLNEYKANTPPDIELYKNIDFKITKNFYNTGKGDFPFIHTKLYIMDCPTSTNKSGMVAFLGSVNFGYAAFYQNQEFLLETYDENLIKELKNYFENFYESIPQDSILTEDEIKKVLFNKGFISYNDIKI